MPGRWRSQSVSVHSLLVEACWRPMVGDVAGDFHDVLDLRDGRVAVVIGDVAGFGPVAAERAEDLRGAIGLVFRRTDCPAAVLRALDDRIRAQDGDLFVTMACAVIDPATRTVEVANAGHPPIVFADRLEARLLDEAVEPPLGLPAARESVAYQIPSDTALFLYTDGLVERRGDRLDEALEMLIEVSRGLHGAAASAAEMARRATSRLGQPADDATVVSVRFLPEGVRRAGTPAPSTVIQARQEVQLRVYLDPRQLRSMRVESVVNELVLRARSDLEVKVEVMDITVPGIDVETDGVLAAPTIVRAAPQPRIRVVGSVRTAEELARALQVPLDEEAR